MEKMRVKPVSAPATGRDAAGRDRLVQSVIERTGAPPAHVRALFDRELARLGSGATVRSFLFALTASRVRAMLRNNGARAGS
jgi:hypothetical protein